MIYCVIPRELADELYDKMVDYYKDNPNVTVIVDRREGRDRRRKASSGSRTRKSGRCATAAAPIRASFQTSTTHPSRLPTAAAPRRAEGRWQPPSREAHDVRIATMRPVTETYGIRYSRVAVAATGR